jgi:hypothetical protein
LLSITDRGLCSSNPSSKARTKLLLLINLFSFESSLLQALSHLRKDLNFAEITRVALPLCTGRDHKCWTVGKILDGGPNDSQT